MKKMLDEVVHDSGLLFAVADCAVNLFARLDQIQFDCPFDGCTAIIDIELAEDALGMGADRAYSDYEFTSDLWHGKLRLKQAEYFVLTLTEWLDQF